MNYSTSVHLSLNDDCIDALSGHSVILLPHPTDCGQLVAYPGGAVHCIYRDGTDVRTGNLCVVKRPDIMIEAREKWDALSEAVRQVLIYTFRNANKKIAAIKALHELTGLGLTQAKRAIEEFSA